MQTIRQEVREHRSPEHDIDPLFVNRWSPRSMTGESLAEEEFLPLFEAARWAPSSRNEQPWRENPNGRKPQDEIVIEGGFREVSQR